MRKDEHIMSMHGHLCDAGGRMAAAAEQSIQQSIVEAKADVREAKEQLQGATGDEKVALQQRLAALEQRLATLEQQKLLLMQQQSGAPQLYRNIILHIAGDTRNPEEFVRTYARVGRSTLQKVLDGLGCDVVQVPGTDQLVGFDALELHDNMLLTALRYSVPWDARVSTLEGFVSSSVKGFEEDATEAVFRYLQQQHSNAEVLPIRHIASADGKRREVDGAVVADGCAAILEAKQVLDDTAVSQLASCMEFIRHSELTGPAAQLKNKKLLGFLAGRTLCSDPGKVDKLVRDCRQHGYGIYVSSGQSLSLGNSRMPRLRVDCAMCTRVRAPSSPVRVLV